MSKRSKRRQMGGGLAEERFRAARVAVDTLLDDPQLELYRVLLAPSSLARLGSPVG
jgi:hypothetical protein